MAELVRPAQKYQASFLGALREAQAAGSGLADTLTWDPAELEADFPAFLAGLRRYEPGQTLPESFVPSEVWWLVEGDEFLGRLSIRHTLNERLREFGGHIGYEVRPSARRRGHATRMLRLALLRASALGIERALVTCDADNLGSRAVIEANGGEPEGEFRLDFHPVPVRRYWIRTAPLTGEAARLAP